MSPIPIGRNKPAPTTMEIVDQMDELVGDFREKLDALREAFEEECGDDDAPTQDQKEA
jgi:hypothetical protein